MATVRLAGSFRVCGTGPKTGLSRFDQQAGQGQLPDQFLLLAGADHGRGDGKKIAGLDRGQSGAGFTVKGMQLDPGGVVFQQQGYRMTPGRAGVNVERQVQFPGQFDKTLENRPLKFLLRTSSLMTQ
jgi:hypothetical protein